MGVQDALTEIGQIKWWLDCLSNCNDVGSAEIDLWNIKDACDIMLAQLKQCEEDD